MKKTQRKDAVRNIKKRIVSYLSICLVIMLGLGGLLITRYMSAGVDAEANRYYSDHNFKNFELLSSLGINDADIEQIRQTEGVIDAEGVIRTSGSLTKGTLNSSIELISMTERVSVPEVVEGKAPAAKNECMVGEDFALIKGINIGDKVKIVLSDKNSSEETADDETADEEDADKNENDEGVLLESEFTVTGFMKHPDYFRRKSTDTVVLPWSAFNMEYLGDMQYSHVFVKTEEPEGTGIFANSYFKQASGTKQALEELAETLEADSLARAKARINADLDREWQAALDELNDAQAEIDSSEADMNAELAKAIDDLNDAQAELDSMVKDATLKIRDGETEIKAGEAKIKAGEAKINAGEAMIKQNAKKISKAESAIKAGEKKIKKSEKEIKDAKEKLKMADENLPAAKKYVEETMADYEEQLNENLEILAYVNGLLDKLKDLDPESEEFKNAAKELAEFIASNEDKMKDLQEIVQKDEIMEAAEKLRDITGIDGTGIIEKLREFDVEKYCGYARDIAENGGDLSAFIEQTEGVISNIEEELKTFKEYKDYIKQYEENRDDLYKQVADKEKELKAAKAKLATAKKELAAAKAKLAAARQKLAAAKQELAAARQKLEAAKNKLASAKSELASKNAEYSAQINDGWNMYYSKKAEYEEKLEEAKALLADNREEAEQKFAELKAEVDSLECVWLVLDRRANAGYVDVSSNISAMKKASLIFGVLFMLITAIVCFSTLTIIIEEQKKMVGTVKAFGFLKREILGKYLAFGVSSAVIGCIAGIALALGTSGIALSQYHASGMYQYDEPKSVMTPGVTVTACALMIAICAIATVIACSDILKSPASILMKGGSGKKSNYRKKSSRRGGSLYSKLIMRNMMDDKARVVISVIIIAFSTLLVGTGISMKLAFDGMSEKQLSEVYKYDVRIDLGGKMDAEEQGAIGEALANYGIEYMQASYESHVFRLGDRLDMINVLTGDPDELEDFIAVSDAKTGEALQLPEDGVLAQKKMKESYGLGEGSTISIFSSDLTDECEADIKGEFQNYVGRLIITSPEGYRSIFGEQVCNNCYYVKLCGADLETFEDDLRAVSDGISFEEAAAFSKKFEAVSFLYNLIVYVTTGIAVLMSFMILSNLANICLNRKKTELTIMRINGFSIKQTKAYLSRETIVTTAAGVAIGVAAGALFSPLIIMALEQPDLQFVRSFHIEAWVIAVALEVLFSISINGLVFRKVKDLNFRDVA